MNSLFKQEKPKAQRVCRVENLDPEKCITQSYSVSRDQREHVVVLCLANKTVKTKFLSELGALQELSRNRALYKAKKALR